MISYFNMESEWKALSSLPSSKGVSISYLCEPEQYGHINEGLVIVPMIIYMSKHWDSEKGFIYPVVFIFLDGTLGFSTYVNVRLPVKLVLLSFLALHTEEHLSFTLYLPCHLCCCQRLCRMFA